jgi:hypothetical protein
MDILNRLNKLNAIGKYLIIAFIVLNVVPVSFASAGLSAALISLCSMAKLVLGIGVMLMIILAGTIYAVGQILGAETRARAAVWATAMLTGAVIGIIIYIVTPVIISALLTGNSSVVIKC